MGGIAGYFGGVVDNIIMRICDILMCLPGVPILLIISLILDSADVDAKYRIYLLMIYLTLFSWPGTARLVRGQILSLREQACIPYPEVDCEEERNRSRIIIELKRDGFFDEFEEDKKT